MATSRSAAQSISDYNRDTKFTYELRESRLKKCVRIIDRLPIGAMLDIGCSTGDWSALWQGKGWKCSGLGHRCRDCVRSQRARDRCPVL